MKTHRMMAGKTVWVTVTLLLAATLTVVLLVQPWRSDEPDGVATNHTLPTSTRSITPPGATPTGEALVDHSPMTDVPCAAPCWQGITPGETSRSQAMRILESSPYIRQDSLEESGTKDLGGVLWRWHVSGKWLQPGLWWQDGIVQEIRMGLGYDLTVDQVVGKYGPPEALSAGNGGMPEYSYWIIDLYYPNVGVQFTAYTSEATDLLEPSTEVGVVSLFAPTSLEGRVEDVFGHGDGAKEFVSHEMSLLRPWRGYGNLFEAYYDSPAELEFPLY